MKVRLKIYTKRTLQNNHMKIKKIQTKVIQKYEIEKYKKK